MDTHTIIDILSLVVAVVGAYLASVLGLERRIAKLETKIGILVDRDRRKRLADYDGEKDSEDSLDV